jgi:hypothetical protein
MGVNALLCLSSSSLYQPEEYCRDTQTNKQDFAVSVARIWDSKGSAFNKKAVRSLARGFSFFSLGCGPGKIFDFAYTALVRKRRSVFDLYQSSRTTIRVLIGGFIAAPAPGRTRAPVLTGDLPRPARLPGDKPPRPSYSVKNSRLARGAQV